MCFGQLTFRQSLRDVSSTLNALGSRRYHVGLRGSVPLSTLSDASSTRPWQIYQDLALLLIEKASKLNDQKQTGTTKAGPVFALDSSTIDLCLSLFPWATFHHGKAAVKMHTIMDIEGLIPVFIHISEGRVHDVIIFDRIPVQPGAIYIMDRGYIDFARLFSIRQQGAKFVVRAKKNVNFTENALLLWKIKKA